MVIVSKLGEIFSRKKLRHRDDIFDEILTYVWTFFAIDTYKMVLEHLLRVGFTSACRDNIPIYLNLLILNQH